MCLLDWGRHNTTLAAARCLQTACLPARLPSDIPLAAHSVAIIASLSLAACLRSGAEGPRWSLQEVRGLEACTERALQLCKSWLPADLKRPLQQELTRVSGLTDQQAAEHPGQTYCLQRCPATQLWGPTASSHAPAADSRPGSCASAAPARS